MEMTSVAIPPMTPPKRAAFFARLASESVFCGVSVGGEEAVLGKLEGVVVEMEEVPVELVIVEPAEGFGAPPAISKPGPISGIPKNVGVKRAKKSRRIRFLPPKVLELFGFQLFSSCHMLSISVGKETGGNEL